MRLVSNEMAAALRQRVVRPCMLFDYDHPAGRLRLWTGFGSLRWNEAEWTQGGILVQISPIEQTTELQVMRIAITIAGLDLSEEARRMVLSPVRRAPLVIYRAFLDRSLNVIRDPIVWFRGYGDPPKLQDKEDGLQTVVMQASGAIFNLVKPRRTLLSHNEQQARFPGDTGLRFMSAVTTSRKQWTIGSYNNFSPL